MIQKHLRTTFLAGVIATVPVAITAFAVWYVETNTRFLSEKLFGQSVPFVGIVIGIVAIYLVGLAVRSLIGRIMLRIVDAMLSRLPGIKAVYAAWKHVAVTPGDGAGMFDRVVLIDTDLGSRQLGFTNGVQVGADMLCVFVPACPNPMNGQLHFVPVGRCRATEISAEEAFKVLLSTGNYLPALLKT